MSTGPKNLDSRLLRYRARRGNDGAAALAADLLDASRSADALEVTGAALKASPGDGELLLLEGRARFVGGDLLGAQATLLKAAKALPQRKDPFRWLGEVLMKRGDPERAAKVLERALAIDPGDVAVARLSERAKRLANVAETAGSDPAPPQPPQERTVLRTELTEQLRSMIEEVDAKDAGLEEEPTRVFGGERLAALEQASSEEAAAPPAKKRKHARTMAFDAAAPAPPRAAGGVADVALATDGEIDGALGMLDEAAESSVPPGASSFGAMRSAPPSPPTRAAAQAAPARPLPPKPAALPPAKPAASKAPAKPFEAPTPFLSSKPAPPFSSAKLPSKAAPPFSSAEPASKAASPFSSAEPASKGAPPFSSAKPFPSAKPVSKPRPPLPTAQPASKPAPRGKAGPVFDAEPGGSAAPPAEVAPESRSARASKAAPFEPGPAIDAAPIFEEAPTPEAGSLGAGSPGAGSPGAGSLGAGSPGAGSLGAGSPGAGSPGATSPFESPPRPSPDQPDASPAATASPFSLFDGAPPDAAAPTPPTSASFVAHDQPGSDAPRPAPAGKEDVDGILHMLREEGLFEPPSGEPAQWAARAEVVAARKGTGTRIGVWLGVLWVLAIGAAVGGWYGWQWHVGERHRQAASLVANARDAAHRGDHADLVAAEDHLRHARELDPHDVEGPTLLLFVQAQRALEDGAFDASFLRQTIARAEEADTDPALLDAARAVLAAAEGDHDGARTHVTSALGASPDDVAVLYIAGRLSQRLGGEDGANHLEAAAEAEAAFTTPRIALAERHYERGQAAEASALLDGVLAAHEGHLRATLWRAFVTAGDEAPEAALAALDALADDVSTDGAATDRVLAELTRARLLRRQGDIDGAGEAVDAALQAGSSQPRLLGLVAAEGRRAGRTLRAEQAARTALRGAPDNTDLRKLLAEIELARRDGRGALATLADLDAADPDVLEMRARAALLVGGEEALQAAETAIDGVLEDAEEPSVTLRALRIRMRARRGERDALRRARALARTAPGDAQVALALGEAALAARDAGRAVEALTGATRSSPDDSEAHYLLGRAHRMAGDGEAAEASLRRAVELTAEHTEARLALGGLLLDMGRYDDADALYTELASRAGSAGGRVVNVAGRLGRIEALTGLRRLEDANVQLEALHEEARETPSARIAAARLALARGNASDALTELRPLATADGVSASVLALYADALLEAGQVEPAADTYEAAIGIDAALPEALLGQAEMAVRSDRGRDALELLGRIERALEARVRPPAMRARMHLLRGRAHLLDGRDGLDAARNALRQAVAIEAAPAEAHFFLGEALAGADSPEARASYERYLELAPDGDYAARARRATR